MAKGRLFFNYFKHVPDVRAPHRSPALASLAPALNAKAPRTRIRPPQDLVITSTPGMVISLLGTILMCTLFVFEVNAYLSVTSSTTLVVDELVDEVLRANFNVTLHQVPCEYLSVDVSDLTGTSRHNITKDILKWRLDSNQRPIGGSMAVTAHAAGEIDEKKHENAGLYFDPDEEPEPADTKYSQHLTEAEFPNFLAKHELTLVNYYAPWCIWCRRLEPVYLDAASHVPDLQFHGHARLAQARAPFYTISPYIAL